MVPENAPTLHCPREPLDARCQFLYWWDSDSPDLVDELTPYERGAPEGESPDQVDEADIELVIARSLDPGRYKVIAALPEDLVDMFACENVRKHAWLESEPLSITVATAQDIRRARNLIASFVRAEADGDCDEVALIAEELEPLLSETPEALAMSRADLIRRVTVACLDAAESGEQSESEPTLEGPVFDPIAVLAPEAEDDATGETSGQLPPDEDDIEE